MNKIPTAKELCEKMHKEEPNSTSWIDFNEKVMIEFAKLHVEQALKAAAESKYLLLKVEVEHTSVAKKAILNAYPLTNIK
jgi:hypothetical protein